MAYDDSPCPLCEAHFIEHGTGGKTPDDEVLEVWADSIERLWDRLQQLKAQRERD